VIEDAQANDNWTFQLSQMKTQKLSAMFLINDENGKYRLFVQMKPGVGAFL
jgi:hypothetical protein